MKGGLMNINVIWNNFLEKIKSKTNSLSYNNFSKSYPTFPLNTDISTTNNNSKLILIRKDEYEHDNGSDERR